MIDQDNKPNLVFLTPDLQEFGMPDLATNRGQKLIEKYITDEVDLIIVDNLSCLVRSGKENDGESWLPIQEWALKLRAKGKSVLFIHHSNKNGGQRGTSRKEDVIDNVVCLKHPINYTSDRSRHGLPIQSRVTAIFHFLSNLTKLPMSYL